MTDQEYTGGSVSYYTCSVTHPISETADPYDAECIDIIDALQMTPNEANAFKALWRRAAARLGKSKRGYTDGLYDAEKVEFYGKRLVELERRGRAETEPDPIVKKHVDKILKGEVSFPEGVVGCAIEKAFGPAPAVETDPERIANSNLSATHRDSGGNLYKVCDMSGRWLRFGKICWSFASSDPEAVPAGLKELIRVDPFGPRDADGWYTWNGDETMRPAGQVKYLMRCDVGHYGESGPCNAEALRWNHDGVGGDIVKWRPAINR